MIALILADIFGSMPNTAAALRAENGLSAAQRMVLCLQQVGVRRIIVLAGEAHDAWQRHLSYMGTVGVQCKGGDMAFALQKLEALAGRDENVLLWPAAYPLATATTVQQLVGTTAKLPSVPYCNEQAGYPIVMPPSMLAGWFGSAENNLLPDPPIDAQRILVDDNAIATPLCDSATKQPHKEPAQVRPLAKVYLAAEQMFYGPGPHLLLQLISETQQLREACELMGISYSKGLKMLNEIQAQAGCDIVTRSRGGSHNGQTLLTEKGIELVRRYNQFEARCKKDIQQNYSRCFGDLFGDVPTPPL